MKQINITPSRKKCLIQRYVNPEDGPPFKFETVGEMEVERPFADHLGRGFYEVLVCACHKKGFDFKYYSSSQDSEYDYTVTVF